MRTARPGTACERSQRWLALYSQCSQLPRLRVHVPWARVATVAMSECDATPGHTGRDCSHSCHPDQLRREICTTIVSHMLVAAHTKQCTPLTSCLHCFGHLRDLLHVVGAS
jgi:hypothetical protein